MTYARFSRAGAASCAGGSAVRAVRRELVRGRRATVCDRGAAVGEQAATPVSSTDARASSSDEREPLGGVGAGRAGTYARAASRIREQRDDAVADVRARQTPTSVSGPTPSARSRARAGVRAPVELGVAQRSVRAPRPGPSRRASGRPARDQLVEEPGARPTAGRPVACDSSSATLLVVPSSAATRARATVRRGIAARSRRSRCAASRAMRSASKQVGVYSKRRRELAGVLLDDASDRSNFAVAASTSRPRLDVQAGQHDRGRAARSAARAAPVRAAGGSGRARVAAPRRAARRAPRACDVRAARSRARGAAAPRSSASPARSPRSARVFTKKPISGSSSARARPATRRADARRRRSRRSACSSAA